MKKHNVFQICLLVYLSFLLAATAGAQTLSWTGAVHAEAIGNLLQKTSGCDGCDDAGAASQQELIEGDGYVEFTIDHDGAFLLAGLSHGDEGTSYSDIDFAFRFNGAGWADVLENGVYQSGGDTPYYPGDVFRIAIVGNKVQYIRNGVVLIEGERVVEYPVLLDVTLGTMGAAISDAVVAVTLPPDGEGGFLEKAGSQTYRARFTPSEIDAFLPPNGARGAFTFPAPYGTEGVRLTNASDCADGQDCLWYLGYSYWRNINNHRDSPLMLIMVGTDRNRGGAGPSLIAYNKVTDEVQNLGPLFSPNSGWSYATGEGWYFSGTRPTTLYTYFVGSPQLQRYDVIAKQFDAVPALDLGLCPRPTVCPGDAGFINQPHSSDDDLVHSATVQNWDWQRTGCVVYRSDIDQFQYFAVTTGYTFDECHVDKSGRWLIILEMSPNWALNNRIVDLQTGAARTIEDVQGGLGHLDTGYGYAVGADNYNAQPNATILLKFDDTATERPVGPAVHVNKRWDIAALNHVAHGNAVAGAAESQYVCGSNASRVPDMADEIVCVPLDAHRNADGSLDTLVVGQTLTSLDASGGGNPWSDYERMPKGNLDVTGRYFIWTTNMGGDRLDVFLVKIPADLLMAP
jgi:hypothetical protein